MMILNKEVKNVEIQLIGGQYHKVKLVMSKFVMIRYIFLSPNIIQNVIVETKPIEGHIVYVLYDDWPLKYCYDGIVPIPVNWNHKK